LFAKKVCCEFKVIFFVNASVFHIAFSSRAKCNVLAPKKFNEQALAILDRRTIFVKQFGVHHLQNLLFAEIRTPYFSPAFSE